MQTAKLRYIKAVMTLLLSRQKSRIGRINYEISPAFINLFRRPAPVLMDDHAVVGMLHHQLASRFVDGDGEAAVGVEARLRLSRGRVHDVVGDDRDVALHERDPHVAADEPA